MNKTFFTCTKFLSIISCFATLFSCGKALKTEDSGDDPDAQRRYLNTKQIDISSAQPTYKFLGSGYVYLPSYLNYQSGSTQNSVKLTFSKGIYMQEFTCYYDFSQNSGHYELDECYLTDDPSESLLYNGGQEIYQAQDDKIELTDYEANVNTSIEVDWFAK